MNLCHSKERKMKKVIYILAGTISVTTMIAMTAKAQETLVFAGSGGSTEKIIREKILPAFEQAHNVKITYVAGNSTDTLAKLQAQKDNQEIDVAMIDDGPIMRAVSLGFCAPLQGVDQSKLHDVARLPGGRATGLGIIATGLMYNTEVFKKNGWAAPTSWNDLKDPKYKGKVVMPPLNNGYGLLTVVMLARMNGGGEKNIDPGFKVMKDSVGPNILAYEASPAKHAELFQTGQAIFGVWGSSRVQPLAAAGVPVEFVYPVEGAPAVMTAICPVARKTVSPKAHAFVQMMLSPETQGILADEAGFAPVHKDAKVKNVGMMPVGALAGKLVSADWDSINPVRDEWNKRWVREIER
jgi:putative spermidine/putrescine transport system substrate-binding protein